MTTRWVRMSKTSPSGRTLYECSVCKRESYGQDKTCAAGCEGPESGPDRASWEIDPGLEFSPRANGCTCQWELGDSPCTVHPTCEECGEGYEAHTRECPTQNGGAK